MKLNPRSSLWFCSAGKTRCFNLSKLSALRTLWKEWDLKGFSIMLNLCGNSVGIKKSVLFLSRALKRRKLLKSLVIICKLVDTTESMFDRGLWVGVSSVGLESGWVESGAWTKFVTSLDIKISSMSSWRCGTFVGVSSEAVFFRLRKPCGRSPISPEPCASIIPHVM